MDLVARGTDNSMQIELRPKDSHHRLRQVDFRKQISEPLFPNVGDSLSSLEEADAVLIVGSYPRHEAPLLNLRIRKAVLKGAKVICINTHGRPFNYAVSKEVIMKPSKLAPYLKELSELSLIHI